MTIMQKRLSGYDIALAARIAKYYYRNCRVRIREVAYAGDVADERSAGVSSPWSIII